MKNEKKPSIKLNANNIFIKDQYQNIFKEALNNVDGIINLSKNQKERFRCYLALSFLSRYPRLIINLEGLIEVIDGDIKSKNAKQRIRRWLQKQTWVNQEIISSRKSGKGIPYQAEELKSSIIGVKRGIDYCFMYSPNTYFNQGSRPPYGYRIFQAKELTVKDQKIVESLLKIKPLIKADNFDAIFREDNFDSIKWIMNEIMEVAGRLLWLMKDCGLGFRMNSGEKMGKVSIDGFMIGYQKIINRIDSGEKETVFKEMVNESMINVAVSEIGLDRTSLLLPLVEDEMVITCSECNYMKVIHGQEGPKSIECKLCGFTMELIYLFDKQAQ